MKKVLKYLSLLPIVYMYISCAPVHERSTIWVDPDASFSKYETLTVENFTNSTDKKSSEYDITGKLTNHLNISLTKRGFALIQTGKNPGKNIIIKNDIVNFEPGSAFGRWFGVGIAGGAIQLSIRTTLIDELSNNILSDFITDAEIIGFSPTVDQDEQVLINVSERIANEINNLIK